jgi:NAD(P)-dependent dehydrogenase (short-subunit alcohol dehydrogenase family)
MPGVLEGNVALVTGGSLGIGKATVAALAKQGAKVVFCARNPEQGEDSASFIRKAGGEASYVKADVSKAADVEALVAYAVEKYGRLDCAFNNAGIVGPVAGICDYTEEDWDTVNDTNLKGVWLCMKYELKQMAQQGHGSIVNCSSAAGLIGFEGIAPYVATKHGIVGLTKSASLEFAKSGIRINAICPGCIDTPATHQMLPEAEALAGFIAAKQPIGRIGRPEEIAAAVVWLCSDAASLVTGIAMSVDGGMAL